MARSARLPSTSRRRGIVVAIVLLIAGLLLPAVPGATGSLIAKVTNSQNTAATSIFGCTGIAVGLGAALAWPLDDAYVLVGTTTARDVSGNNLPGNYNSTGVAYRQLPGSCPRDLAGGQPYAALLDGKTGYVSNPTAFPLTNTFSESIWFRTSTAFGGRIIGFGSSATGASVSYDRMVWMTNTGNLAFGVFPNAYKTITSPLTYNDNKYHLVTATLGSTGQRLYVDGAQVAFDITTTTAQNYTLNPLTPANAMYLRVGYDNLATWTPAPSSSYFNGFVRFADYFTRQLSATEVTALYTNGI